MVSKNTGLPGNRSMLPGNPSMLPVVSKMMALKDVHMLAAVNSEYVVLYRRGQVKAGAG